MRMQEPLKSEHKELSEPLQNEDIPIPWPNPSFREDMLARMRAGELSDGMDELYDEYQKEQVAIRQRNADSKNESDENRN